MESNDPYRFRLLDVGSVENERIALRLLEQELNDEWKTESLKYEESITVPHCSHPVARRNYFNPDGVLQDTSLFPYHDFYYPLIDAYDCLYTSDHEHPILDSAIRPRKDRNPQHRSIAFRIHQVDQQNVEEYFDYVRRCFFTSPVLHAGEDHGTIVFNRDALYTSPDSIVNCILLEDETEMLTSTQWIPADTPSRLYDGQTEFWSELRRMFLEGRTLQEVNINLPSSTILSHEVKVQILLRLLRHSLSEYQRDYYLALSILTRLSCEKALDDVSVLRKLLLIINSECVQCGNFCDDDEENRSHDCGEWCAFMNGLHLTIGLGISVISEEHAVTLASFVRSRYLHEFGHLLEESEAPEKQRRTRLKRVIAALRTEEGPSNLHIQFIEILLRSLGTRANLERKRCREAINRGNVPEESLGTFLRSYWNCIRALVDIGEATIEIIPDSEPYFSLASEVVKNIAYGFMENIPPPSNRVHDIENDEGSTYLMPVQNETYPNVISPCRFLNSLQEKREQHTFTIRRDRNGDIDSQAISAILSHERPHEVLYTVRSLFVRDMVDIRLSRLGYGDFVVWCRFQLNMDDPIMFWPEYQYPVEEDEDTQGSDDPDDYDPWVIDENGENLLPTQLKSRYDFTLLVALRAWQAPWTPLMHQTFSHDFRHAVKELIFCTHRLLIPNEVVLRILPFLDRRWWPSDQPQCWSYSCQLDMITKHARKRGRNETSVHGTTKPLLTCSGCRTAVYCSNKCVKDDLKAGHRRLCYSPVCKRSVQEELGLFRTVFEENIPDLLLRDTDVPLKLAVVDNELSLNVVEGNNTGSVDDDDDSWESWDSNEASESPDAPFNITEIIFHYFST